MFFFRVSETAEVDRLWLADGWRVLAGGWWLVAGDCLSA